MSRRSLSCTVPVLLAAALAATLAGCSGASSGTHVAPVSSASPTPSPLLGKSARVVLAMAQDAVDAAGTVHLKGTIRDSGTTTSLDLKIDYKRGAWGKVAVDGDVINVIRVGKTMYMKASTKFWRKNAPGSEKLFGDQWLKGSSRGNNFKDMASLTTKAFVESLFVPGGSVSTTTGLTVNGTPTVGLLDHDKTAPGVLYIASTGKPYPLQSSTTTTKDGFLAFRNWGDPVTLTPPGGALDLDKLSGA